MRGRKPACRKPSPVSIISIQMNLLSVVPPLQGTLRIRTTASQPAELQGAAISSALSLSAEKSNMAMMAIARAELAIPVPWPGNPSPENVLGQTLNTTGVGRARPTMGYTILPNLLIYVAGGWTFASTNTSLSGAVATSSPTAVSASSNKIVNGGNAGIGVDYAFAPGLIARVEYIYDRAYSEL